MAGFSCQDQIRYMRRAYQSVEPATWDYLPFWERFFVDPPSRTSPLLALGAIVLMLLLPAAPRYDGWRRAISILIGLACLANMVNATAHLWFVWRGREAIGYGSLFHNVVLDLPGYGVSAVLLVLVVETWRWGRRGPVGHGWAGDGQGGRGHG